MNMPVIPCRIACCVCVLVLAACSSHPPAPDAARALRVVGKKDAQCITQMQVAMERPGGSAVVLGPAAFAADDRLSVVPSESVADAAGQPAGGRLLGRPDHFRLILNQGLCTLVRETDARSTPLTACACVAIP